MKFFQSIKEPLLSGVPNVKCASDGYFTLRSSAIASGPIISILESRPITSAAIEGSRRGFVWHKIMRSIREESILVLVSSRQSSASLSNLLRMSVVEVVNAAKRIGHFRSSTCPERLWSSYRFRSLSQREHNFQERSACEGIDLLTFGNDRPQFALKLLGFD